MKFSESKIVYSWTINQEKLQMPLKVDMLNTRVDMIKIKNEKIP